MIERQMKDSGIAWVGEIPQDWETCRTKYCFASTKEIAGTRACGYERLALTMNGVIKRSKDDNTGLQPERFETYQILRPNDLVFKLIDLQNISTSRVGLSSYLGLVSPAYIVLKFNNKVNPKFAEKYFLMMWKNQIFNALGDAGVRSSLNIFDLLEIPLVFPSIDMQKRIADFLDKECEKIDKLKADIQAQIDLLEQYKRFVITETVTHGLNSNATMKDSGIAWVGEIPQEWEMCRTKYCFASTKEIAGIRASDYERLALTMNGVIKRAKDDNTGLQPEKFETYQILRPNELVFKLIDLQNVSTSRVGVSPYFGLVSSAYIILKSNSYKVLPKFAEKYFLMMWKRQIFNALGDTGVRSCLNVADLLEIPLVFPSINEQQRIVDYLDKKCAEIEKTIADKKTQLDTLDEYKKSLIYEYVTGKKEVV